MKNRTAAIAAAGAATIVIGLGALSSCAAPTHQSGPEPDPIGIVDARVLTVYKLPAGFRNAVEYCNSANDSFMETSRGSDLAGGPNGGGMDSTVTLIRLDDPRCAKLPPAPVPPATPPAR
jgi:hypothetical protein